MTKNATVNHWEKPVEAADGAACISEISEDEESLPPEPSSTATTSAAVVNKNKIKDIVAEFETRVKASENLING